MHRCTINYMVRVNHSNDNGSNAGGAIKINETIKTLMQQVYNTKLNINYILAPVLLLI